MCDLSGNLSIPPGVVGWPYDAKVPTNETSVEDEIPLRLRQCRERVGLTLADTAGRVGVSTTHMSRIERGLRQPSIGVLLKLATLYGVGVGELVGEEPAPARKLVHAGTAEQHEGPDGVYTTLSGLAHFSGLEVIRLDVRKGRSKQFSSHADEEWMYVLEGSVDVELGEELLTLHAGDCLHFDARTSHSLSSLGEDETRLLIVSSPLGALRGNGHV